MTRSTSFVLVGTLCAASAVIEHLLCAVREGCAMLASGNQVSVRHPTLGRTQVLPLRNA